MEPTLHFRKLFRLSALETADSASYEQPPEIQQLWSDPKTGAQKWRDLPSVYEGDESDLAGRL